MNEIIEFDEHLPPIVIRFLEDIVKFGSTDLKLDVGGLILAMLEVERLVEESDGVLSEHLEFLVDHLQGEPGEMLDDLFLESKVVESKIETLKGEVQRLQTKIHRHQKVVDRLKYLRARVLQIYGEAGKSKTGNAIWRMETPTGKASCWLHQSNKVIWNGTAPRKSFGVAPSFDWENKKVVLEFDENELPEDLGHPYSRFRVQIEPNDEEIRLALENGAPMPSGVRVVPNYITRRT